MTISAAIVRVLAIAALSQALGPIASAWADVRQKQVLVLYATRRDGQIVTVGERELPISLERGLPEGVDYYSEFIDQARFSHPGYETAFRDFLQSKYQDRRFDVVIAMGDTPLQFVAANRHELFPDTPVVFFASRPPARRPANATGITAEPDFTGTITLATLLQPDLRHIFVVSGANDTNRAFERAAHEQLRSFEPRVTITYLSGLSTAALEDRLASLPEHSAVYYLAVDRDGASERFHPLDYLDRVAAVASAPVYCWVDSAMGHGIVGGSLKDQLAEMQGIAALALRVLQGEPADSIAVKVLDLNVRQVDWRQLRRWGISEARVPAGTLLLHREPSTWDRYRSYILGAAAIGLAQTMLIAALLLQRSWRQQVEKQLRRSQTELRASYDRIRDLGGRLLRAQETERARLASELHDDISQQMTLLEIDLHFLCGAVPSEGARIADDALTRARQVTKSMRDLSHRLHPARLRLIGLVAALDGLQHELSQSDPDLVITLTHDNLPAALPSDLTVSLFRVVQEGLQNAVKHSAARRVSVDLHGDSDRLAVTIADDGRGFDVATAAASGLGMITMRERLEAIGGTFEVHSRPGAGTRLEATVPFHAAA